jgi:hypothetical protein
MEYGINQLHRPHYEYCLMQNSFKIPLDRESQVHSELIVRTRTLMTTGSQYQEAVRDENTELV